jgi:hypothetical protein
MSPALLTRVMMLLLTLSCSTFAAETKSDLSPAEQRQFERLAEIFAPPGTPSIKGKPWVEVDRGLANLPSPLQGWLIVENDMEVKILDGEGDLYLLRKPTKDEVRPQNEMKSRLELFFSQNSDDKTVAWNICHQDFAAKCQKFIEAGVPKDNYNKDRLFKMINDRAIQEWHVVKASQYAHFAHLAGHAALSLDLVHEATQTVKNYQQQHIGLKSVPALHEYVAQTLARRYQRQAIGAASGGTSRRELQQIWAKMAALPHHDQRDEASAMVKHYENLLAEDGRWVEPTAEALAKLTPEQQAAHWLYHLRDLDCIQHASPGVCHVLTESRHILVEEPDKKLPHPAIELEKLGQAAIPQLIAHLDDARPTRCEAYWRHFSPDGRYLLRYGDCCQQIFDAITKQKISEETYAVRAGDEHEAKARAEKWWQEYQAKAALRAKR